MSWILSALLALLVAQQPDAIDAGARDVVARAQQMKDARKAYTATWTAVWSATNTTVSTLTYVAPDRYHAREEKIAEQLVRIGDESWRKRGDRAWERLLLDTASAMRSHRGPLAMDADRYELTAVAAAPSADIKVPFLRAYRYRLQRKETLRPVTVDVTMWIAPSMGLPARFESVRTDEDGEIRESWTIEYNERLTVDRPEFVELPCDSAARCLGSARDLMSAGAASVGVPFYERACTAGSVEACFGFATHLVGRAVATDDLPVKAGLVKQATTMLDAVIKQRPQFWRAHLYKGLALLQYVGAAAAESKRQTAAAQAALARARTVRATASDDEGAKDVLWAPAPLPPPPPGATAPATPRTR